MTRLISLLACCNDPDNGVATGKADCFKIDTKGVLLKVEGIETVFRRLPDRAAIKIGRHTYSLYGYKSWWGNWCWDAVALKVEDAEAVFESCRKRGWECTDATTTLWGRWHDGTPLGLAAMVR